MVLSVDGPLGSASHLYVHLPYCRARCPYCEVPVVVGQADEAADFLELVIGELALWRSRHGLACPLDSLYIGGGTPSFHGRKAMARLRDGVGSDRVSGDPEWTAECNPEDVTDRLLAAWIDAGVNRVSLGTQSLDDRTLAAMGRPHRRPEALLAMQSLAEKAGLGSWNADLVLAPGLGGVQRVLYDLERILEFAPPHLTLVGLSANDLPGRLLPEGPEYDDAFADEYLAARERLADTYEPVDGLHFARPGHVSRHRLAQLRGAPVLGVGPGARSDLSGVRIWNLESLDAYGRAVRSANLPVAGTERPDPGSLRLEWLWRSLGSGEGLPVRSLPPAADARLDRWIDAGWCMMKGERVVLTAEGWLRLDALTLELESLLPTLTRKT